MKSGTYNSGLPEVYESWPFENLKKMVKQLQYKNELETFNSIKFIYFQEKKRIKSNLSC